MRILRCLILLLLLLMSCTPGVRKNGDFYVIRYVDLQRVYAFALKAEKGAPLKVDAASTDEETKKRIYGRIKTAISHAAGRHNADFILNTGDAVLYARTSYDITDDVIREYKKLNDIASPDVK